MDEKKWVKAGDKDIKRELAAVPKDKAYSKLGFLHRAIRKFQTPEYKGVNFQWRGVDKAFCDYFGVDKDDFVTEVKAYHEKGMIFTRGGKTKRGKGFSLAYLPEERPAGFTDLEKRGEEALAKILA